MKPFHLWKNRQRAGVYYYRLPGGPWRSTGRTREDEALSVVLEQVEKAKQEAKERARAAAAVLLRVYLEPFYRWGSCPHVRRLLAEKKQIGHQHVRNQRSLLDNYVLKDPIADMTLQGLRRGDLVDLRARLLTRVSDRQANRVLGALKACLREAVYRQDLEKDPTAGVGNIREEHRERGIFSEAELRRLFPTDGLGPWPDLQAYACFLLAATVGLRRGELLALRWRDVDLSARRIRVERAWKSDTELGPPKWGKPREAPLPLVAVGRLKTLRRASEQVLPDALVFCDQDGRRLPALWWRTTFEAAMAKAKIPAAARCLTPHSFRHSLNTLLRAQGVPADQIRAAMGWTSEKVQDGYTHYGAGELRGQADLVDKLLG